MNELTLIRSRADHHGHDDHHHVRLVAARSTLAKRRWRGRAEDGREFGFDLDQALPPGSHFHIENGRHYVLAQEPEEVLEISVGTIEQAARLAWSLGNLHFGVQVLDHAIRVTEDPAVLQLLAREGIDFARVTCVFLPLSAGAHADHAHHAHG
jgi:urease accessory protein